VIAYGIFINTFDLFGEPEKTIIDKNCDYEGLRQATVYNFGGNAVTIPLIVVSIDLGCTDKPNDKEKKVIFSAEHKGGSVETNWLTFDTLKITYTQNLTPITQIEKIVYPDTSLNVNVIFVKGGTDNETEEVVYEEYLGKRLKPIRENFKEINGIKEWTAIDKRALKETTEGGAATYYFLFDTLKKIAVHQFGETGKKISEYYTMNAQLSFVFEKTYEYNRPITWDSAAMKENNDSQTFNIDKSEIIEDRSYFENGILIRQINNQDCGSPMAEDFLKEEKERLQTEFNNLVKRLKK
jgi:hypothetical protein